MSEVILHGVAPSSYVRTCRMALDEKGVAYTHDPVMPQTPEQLARHPWGKIPALSHGGVTLFESLAITRYVDEAFEGPALQPADPADRAQMDQWISA
jgi:glutathione S-transferase